jgi:hypothetical protein
MVVSTSRSGTTTASELLARSRSEQGLPPTLDDDAVVERVATLLRSSKAKR